VTVAAGLQGALLLARGRREGILQVDAGRTGAARSFIAIGLCLPAFLCLLLLDWSEHRPPATPGHALAVELLAYLIGWIGFAVLSEWVVSMGGRADRWPLFIAAWNWCNVVQYMLWVAASIPHLLGVPALIDQTIGLVALGWSVWLEWYAARLALDIGGLAASGLVALDVGLGLILSAVTAALS
jgi:hypothetical protein